MSQPFALGCACANTYEEYIHHIISLLRTDDQNEIAVTLVHLNLLNTQPGSDWLQLVDKVVNTVPLEEPFGASAISYIFKSCLLPSVETILQLQGTYGFNRSRALAWGRSAISVGKRRERNLLVFLSCMADKYAGHVSGRLFTDQMIQYLITFIIDQRDPDLVYYSLITMEKFAKTRENRVSLIEYLAEKSSKNPLLDLEQRSDSENPQWRQVGFLARWLLDNILLVEGRALSYTTTVMTGLNAILDFKDSSYYMKVSPSGLEVRSDVTSLETIRCTHQVNDKSWYYEVTVLTPGVMQIGWVTKDIKIKTFSGFGIADDNYSISYDGCRGLIYHHSEATQCTEPTPWGPGDVVGCFIDLNPDRPEAIFTLNGVPMTDDTNKFRVTSNQRQRGLYAAASLSCFQSAIFNFGASEFKFPPRDRDFMTINDHGTISEEDKQVVPRWLYHKRLFEMQAEEQDDENICTICYDRKADTILSPCKHRGFCRACAYRMASCPLCRCHIIYYAVVPL